MVKRRERVKRPGLRSEGMEEVTGEEKGGKEHQEFLERRDAELKLERRGEETRGEETRGEEVAGLVARGGEARATDQEPGSQGTEQVQPVSEAFGPEGAARA